MYSLHTAPGYQMVEHQYLLKLHFVRKLNTMHSIVHGGYHHFDILAVVSEI